jgi:hypothetical protein
VITQSKLKKLLHYNPDTGDFTWKITSGRAFKGNIAGCYGPKGYTQIRINMQNYRAHRLAFLYMEGYMPKEVEHLNHCVNDNRWENLAATDSTKNAINRPKRVDNKTGITGVGQHRDGRRWTAYIALRGKQTHFGIFTDFFEACCTRKSAENTYFNPEI